jgi:hypothetical protein
MSEVHIKLGGHGTLNGLHTPAGNMFSVYDYLDMLYHTRTNYSYKLWSNLLAEDLKLETPKLQYKMKDVNRQLGPKTHRARLTPVMTLCALRILGNTLDLKKVDADAHRSFEDIFARFRAGDTSMIEVRRKPFFADPGHKPRPQQPGTDTPDPQAGAKRQLELDAALFNIELCERQMTIHERHVTLQERSLELREKSWALDKAQNMS